MAKRMIPVLWRTDIVRTINENTDGAFLEDLCSGLILALGEQGIASGKQCQSACEKLYCMNSQQKRANRRGGGAA